MKPSIQMKNLLLSLMFIFLPVSAMFADPVPAPVVGDSKSADPKADPIGSLTKERDVLKDQLAAMTHQLTIMNARVNELLRQRNEALDQLALARADLAVIQQQKGEERK